MLIVAGEIVVAGESIEGAREALRAMESETRKEPGCRSYAFSVDVTDPNMLRIFEVWESMDALRSHFATPHMAAFGAAVAGIQPKSLVVKAYDVAGEVPLPR